jgi:acetyltransferase
MSVRNLEYLFRPGSVAVIGASNRPQRVGTVLMRNLLEGGFEGPIMPVNPKYASVAGVLAYPDIASLPMTPDLAVICTPAVTVPGLVDELGQRGTRAAIVITAGLGRHQDEEGVSLQQRLREIAHTHGMRLIGPNCLGLLVPGSGLNASFSHVRAQSGQIGFVSQSGALATSILDWAGSKNIGFSHFVSLGDALDVDFGDTLDYLAGDPGTKAILLYIESIHERRSFMSAARAAARIKPVVVIKAGRVAEGAKAAASHTGALAGADNVYDAAISRAGMLRVYDFHELFAAVETLARISSVRPLGERLAIVTNGGGPGVMAVDRLIDLGGTLAELAPETIEKLDAVLPATWSRSNPVDIIGDAPGSRYAAALDILLHARELDAVLVMHAPTAIASSSEGAQAVLDTLEETKGKHGKYVLTNWMGEDAVAEARDLFSAADIPTYRTPEGAVGAFMHMVHYRRNQELLTQTPPSAPEEFKPATATARLVIESALAGGREMLGEAEAKAVFSAYAIPVVETHVAADPAGAAATAKRMGFPVALKVLSDQISHKSDVGGVVLDLDSADKVQAAAEGILARVAELFPDVPKPSFTVQKMARMKGAQELIIGATTDPIFGPVLLFGQGGTAVEVIGDRAVALPPLNMSLARELIRRTRIYKLLEGYRDTPSADLDAICLTLIKVAQLMIDLPEIVELDINPLFAGPEGVLALDARIRVAPAECSGPERLAIRPYPQELEEKFALRDGRQVLLRPIRPEDEEAHYTFLGKLAPQDIYYRFFGVINPRMEHREMARLTQIDYDREMAFIATGRGERGEPETLGVVRTLTDPDNTVAEYAIITRSDLKGQGLGRKLMQKMIDYTRTRGTRQIVGQILPENQPMIGLARALGFSAEHDSAENVTVVRLPLHS